MPPATRLLAPQAIVTPLMLADDATVRTATPEIVGFSTLVALTFTVPGVVPAVNTPVEETVPADVPVNA